MTGEETGPKAGPMEGPKAEVNEALNEAEPKEERLSKTVVAVVILFGVAAVLGIYLNIKPVTYSYTARVAGVNVYSSIPLEDILDMKSIVLFNNSNKAAVTCNFELSAISHVDRGGYKVFVEGGEQGIYVHGDSVYIRGVSDEEVLQACNVFSCIRENITCSGDLWGVRDSILDSRKVNVILDVNVRGAGLRGYGELLGALGYVQGENVMVDLNGDGRIERWEIERNLVKIFPHIRDGDECKVQPISTTLQKLNATNETFKCSELHPSITLLNSGENAIRGSDGDVVISGDDDHIGSACIILRDAISPEFIRSLYRMN